MQILTRSYLPLVFLFLGSFITLIGANPVLSDTLRLVYPQAPRSLDPHIHPADPHAIPMIMNSYKRLFELQPGSNNLDNTNSLALTYRVSDDGLRYTIILKDGETFADGTPVTPEAVLFSLDRLVASEAGQVYFPFLKYMRIDGPSTFVLGLSKPFPGFLNSLTLPQASIISPTLAGYPEDYLKDHSLGSGRYIVDGYSKESLVMNKRGDKPSGKSPDRVEFYFEADPDKRLQTYIEKEAHLAILTPPITKKAPEGSNIRTYPTWTTRFLAFNMENPYLSSTEVREALTLISQEVFVYKPIRPQSLLPRGFFGAPAQPGPESLHETTVAERAGELIRLKGAPPVPLRLAFHTEDSQGYEDARDLAERFSAFKIPTLPVPLTGAAGRGILERGDYDIYLGTRHPEIPSSEMWLGRFLDSRARIESNPARFKDPQADSHLDNFDEALPRPEREGRVKALAILAATARPYILLYQMEQAVLNDIRLSDLTPHPMYPTYFPFESVDLNPFRATVQASTPVTPDPTIIRDPEPTLDFNETVFEFYE
ncbi:MAG: ABC transporter substrate-binding protein [Deltaproteobacteria bacterium]|jgi:peptide/nickel transport system substrate-binding protein|nr:ABC transporter substrate-binding protein [Deltaproteobacteria bacterium]